MSVKSMKITNEILEGPIGRVTVKLAMPMLIGQILIVMYGLSDSYFVSLIDKKSTVLISAIGLVFPVYFFFMAISLGLSNGVSSLVARASGEKNKSTLEKIGDSGLILASIISLITLIIFYLSGAGIINLLSGVTITQTTINNALSYIYYIIPGFAFLVLFHVLSGILQGEGLMHYPAIAMFLSVILNIILDPIFIFVFNMGIGGAGLATTISIFIAFCFLLIIFFIDKSAIKISFNIKMVSFKHIREIIRVGTPQAGNLILLCISFMLINYCIGSIGEDVLNAWALVSRMDDFILMIGYALASSTITLTGQNYGNNNPLRVKTFQINMYYGLAGSLILAVIYNIFAYPLFGLITSNSSILKNCIQQVRLISFSYTGTVASIILNSLFLGTGRPLPGLILNFIRMYIFAIPLCYIFVFVFHYGVFNVLIIFIAINILTLIAVFIWAQIFLKNLKYKTIYK